MKKDKMTLKSSGSMVSMPNKNGVVETIPFNEFLAFTEEEKKHFLRERGKEE